MLGVESNSDYYKKIHLDRAFGERESLLFNLSDTEVYKSLQHVISDLDDTRITHIYY